MIHGIIYRAWSPSGKSYIGQTTQSLQTRKNKHRYAALTLRQKSAFGNAIRYHGWDKIKWEILHKNIVEDQLNTLEIQEIERFNSFKSGYNSTIGGDGLTRRLHSSLSKQKMIQNHWARDSAKRTEVISNISKQLKGRTAHNKGKIQGPLKEEHKKKIGQKVSGEQNGNSTISNKLAIKIGREYTTCNTSQRKLAIKYKISKGGVVSAIKRYGDWEKLQISKENKEKQS